MGDLEQRLNMCEGLFWNEYFSEVDTQGEF